ncbi:hypothetical protein [Shewanella fidelis]|uniref:Uncharacterized protein n=1 Tax=Shewanella fidelis TaxID=173509 RepID=A0AAW8NQT6_9GAMM|nr:hypothetical protein [Shewanella fidelis]MDR8525072.1 hypothetical protein [Shewanella fidelis]MDW4811143.1 hypothetical protein [Shewanella fidelis]MDW4815078.1 hypothetical protein [Shewanella fidelis]MDW4819168.1 hypothetical protein [Shewanella fidelis]MDW4823154.1 hypothetical protein [Shewanella fidelis]
MAFDYGSIDIGLKNPFKKEGAVTSLRGLVTTVLGVYLLIEAAAVVRDSAAVGWILVVFGLFLLGSGLKITTQGIIAMLRYFVGRNHPTSLAYNHSRSETTSAEQESGYVAYTKQRLIEMLVGRKNATFVEPQGFLARLVHTIFPKLTFMPYPVRNMAQRLFGAWVKTVLALVAYALTAFVSLAGFAGEIGEFAFPIYSILLTLYLIGVWRSAGRALARSADRNIPSMGTKELAKVIATAIVLPVVLAAALAYFMQVTSVSMAQLQQMLQFLPDFHAWAYFIAIVVAAIISSALISMMIFKRMALTDPKVEVSELRDNWQESIHPNEIFINLDNLVMANRRYKEVPNRVYQELEPKLNEQVEGKGNFFGEMLQEIQPKFKAMDLGAAFTSVRMLSLILGNALFVCASVLTVWLAFGVVDLYNFVGGVPLDVIFEQSTPEQINSLSDMSGTIIHLTLVGILLRAFAHMLANGAHLFFAEMQFVSQLIYMKVEGTFTESRISTGTGIHDSTRSENTLVRSSITPWVVVTQAVSSTFAATGMRNLEHPRYILEMHKDEQSLDSIRRDVVSFIKDRESIAAITSERDLRNASQIHEINEQSRAIPMQSQDKLAITEQEEQAAALLRQQAEEDTKAPTPA